MEKLKRVSPHSLEGDAGWQMRDNYNEVIRELTEYEGLITQEWQANITAELTMRLKQPLLVGAGNLIDSVEQWVDGWVGGVAEWEKCKFLCNFPAGQHYRQTHHRAQKTATGRNM